ncbi:hypothetical protein [Alcanivorax sp. 1008]|uniref:hypothetical protein n=1 Tax=Alcanivorax sp. 1008 TaxID=2816853 RepID=UPI001D1A8B8E|nr:hypothetical protein [Alcanivorax sp. 1008]MCC1496941.1 hypothetical protein [Alcanivorax sp. 1008]
MLSNKIIRKLLRELCVLYKKEHGQSVSKLSEWCFSYSILADEPALMRILQAHYVGDTLGDGLESVFQELVARGLLEEHPDGTYFITETGYSIGLESGFERFMRYLNLNPGANTFIAILALIVSVIALLVAA